MTNGIFLDSFWGTFYPVFKTVFLDPNGLTTKIPATWDRNFGVYCQHFMGVRLSKPNQDKRVRVESSSMYSNHIKQAIADFGKQVLAALKEV